MENKDVMTENKNEVKIKLSKGYDLDGKTVDELSMRVPPTVKDALTAAKIAGPKAIQEEKDVALVANLCNIPLDFLETLDYKDYRTVIGKLNLFL